MSIARAKNHHWMDFVNSRKSLFQQDRSRRRMGITTMGIRPGEMDQLHPVRADSDIDVFGRVATLYMRARNDQCAATIETVNSLTIAPRVRIFGEALTYLEQRIRVPAQVESTHPDYGRIKGIRKAVHLNQEILFQQEEANRSTLASILSQFIPQDRKQLKRFYELYEENLRAYAADQNTTVSELLAPAKQTTFVGPNDVMQAEGIPPHLEDELLPQVIAKRSGGAWPLVTAVKVRLGFHFLPDFERDSEASIAFKIADHFYANGGFRNPSLVVIMLGTIAHFSPYGFSSERYENEWVYLALKIFTMQNIGSV